MRGNNDERLTASFSTMATFIDLETNTYFGVTFQTHHQMRMLFRLNQNPEEITFKEATIVPGMNVMFMEPAKFYTATVWKKGGGKK